MRIAAAELVRYRLPLTAPLPLSTGTLPAREGVLLRVVSEEGAVGWGEASPLAGFSPDTLPQATAELDALVDAWRGRSADEGARDRVEIDAAHLSSPSARFAAESALATARAAHAGQTLAEGLWADPATTVELNALLIGTGDEVVAAATQARAEGYKAAKLKVGRQSIADDVRLVRDVADALGAEVALRLDANRAWTLAAAIAFAEAVRDVAIAYVEEPLADPSGLPELTRRTSLPVALDETVLAIEPADLADHDYVSAIVLKPTFLGLSRTVAWIEAARRRGLEAVVSAAFETGVGMRTLVALAAGTSVPAGLDTYRWLGTDVIRPRLPIAGPRVDVAAVLAHGAVHPEIVE